MDLLSSGLRCTATLARWLIASDILLLPGHDLEYLSTKKPPVFSLTRVQIFSCGPWGRTSRLASALTKCLTFSGPSQSKLAHLEIVLPSYNQSADEPADPMAMASKRISGGLRLLFEPHVLPASSKRCFSTTFRHPQQHPIGPENDRTTHFGFQTVLEAQKESKGWSAFRILCSTH